jgi:hypothetical protein
LSAAPKGIIAMSNEHDEFSSLIRNLRRGWDNVNAVRDELEQRAKQVFTPIEGYLTRMNQALHAVGASVEIDATWAHLADQKLRRVAKVTGTDLTQQLSLDFTVQGTQIFYHNRSYEHLSEIDALKRVIRHETERFLMPRLTSRRIEQAIEQLENVLLNPASRDKI